MNINIFRKTKVQSLPSYKDQKAAESEVNKEEVAVEESGVGDVFTDFYGEPGTEVKPGEVSASPASKSHVRRDDEPEDISDEPPKKTYSGQVVREGVNPSKAPEVENSDLDDLISQAMGGDEEPLPSDEKRSTSTPTKQDDGNNDADFGDAFSLITGVEDEGDDGKKKQKEQEDGNRFSRTGERVSAKPSSGGGTSTTTTSTVSYASRFVPSIPESFYKEIQSRLEDLIFKFECLDNEYAALQKISHNIHEETLEIYEKFTPEY